MWQIQKRIGEKESTCPSKLVLLRGSEVLAPSLKLGDLHLDGPLCALESIPVTTSWKKCNKWF